MLESLLQADRDGKHEEFADTYDVSNTKKQALAQVELASTGQADKLSPETLQELSVRRATTNGFLVTLFVLLKVPSTAPARRCQIGPPLLLSQLDNGVSHRHRWQSWLGKQPAAASVKETRAPLLTSSKALPLTQQASQFT